MAKSVDFVVAQIQGLSGTTKRDLNDLHSFLKQSEGFIKSNYASIIEQLDPSHHSLGYLYTLDACSGSKKEVAALISRFIESCDANQISLATDKFVSVCRKLKDCVMSAKEPIAGVGPMITAVRKLQLSSPEKLTTLHPDALLLCVLAKCYKAGFSLLQDDDFFEVEKPKDFYLYCYYGGMVCIGQKQFGKAVEMLHNVVTAPMSDLSAIAVEAYKKFVLVSLIHCGQFSTTLPKYASRAAQKVMKNYSQLYVDFANKYMDGKISELESFVQTNKRRFEGDSNLGLANQAVGSMYKRSILKLTKTYLNLSLQDIADQVSLKSAKEAEMQVLQMIQDGEIFAAINQKDGMVSFLEDPEQYKTSRTVDHIDSEIQRIMALTKKVKAMDEQIACDPMYLSKFGKDRHEGMEFDDYEDHPMMQFGGYGRERSRHDYGGYGRERSRRGHGGYNNYGHMM